MKKRFIVLCTMVVLCISGCGAKQTTETSIAETSSSSVETVQSDLTMSEVLKEKGEPYINDSKNNQLIYKENFSDYNTFSMYVFDSNKVLKSIMINFTDEYKTKDKYDERFEILRTALISLYGDEYTKTKEGSYIWDLKNEGVLFSMNEDDETVILFSIK